MQKIVGTIKPKPIVILIQHAYGMMIHGALVGARKRNAGAFILKKTALRPILP